MFPLLLNREDKVIYEVFEALQVVSHCSLEALAKKLDKTPDLLKKNIQNWQKNPLNRGTGISFYLNGSQIKGIFTKEDGELFLTTLLHRSDSFQLLTKIVANPYASATSLQRTMNLSLATLNRRIRFLQAFLAPYELTLSFTHFPTLKGNPAQLRWFAWQVSLIADPPFDYSSDTCFQRYLEVHQDYPILSHSSHCQFDSTYYQPPFQLNNRGLLFLWKQLTGIEKIWISKDIHDTLVFALHAHTNINESFFEEIQQRFHQIHCICSFFSGEICLPKRTISIETRRLVSSFQYLLPNYASLLNKHPELPLLYEEVLSQYSSYQQGLWVSEDKKELP